MGSSTKMSSDSPDREELGSLLKLVLLFIVLMLGREMGHTYDIYTEVSQLSIIFDVPEERLAEFVRELTTGGSQDLQMGLMLSLPSARSISGHVTTVPDYARRWLISVYLSPIVVRQPEVSDVEINLWIEDEFMMNQVFSFDREPVPYASLLKRNMSLSIEDIDVFRQTIFEASDSHGGEVEFKFTGTVDAHVLWYKMPLPFFTLRYPLVGPPRFEILSSGWVNSDGLPVSEGRVGRETYVSARLDNPTRVHSIWENVTVSVYEVGSDEFVDRITKTVGIAPQTSGYYVFPFAPEREGVYRYVIEVSGDTVWEDSASFMVGSDG